MSSDPPPRTAGGTAYRLAGSGPPLVFIHGCGLRKEAWDAQVPAFRAGRRVIVYDLLGHGESALGPRTATFEAFSRQLEELLKALGFAATDLVGHSLGGLIGLHFAHTRPARVRSLVVMNGVYDRAPDQRAAVIKRADDIERNGARGSDTAATLARWFGPAPSPQLAPVIASVRNWVENGGDGYATAYRLFANEGDRLPIGRLAQLSMPVLYLTGELDPNSTPAMAHRMAAETPRGSAKVIPGERHLMALAAPDKVNAALLGFLNDAVSVHDLAEMGVGG